MPMLWKAKLESLIMFGQMGYRLYVGREEHDGFSVVQGPVILKKLLPGYAVPYEEAFMDDSKAGGENVRNFLQAMSDAAWEIGIKPKQLEGHTDELKAVRYHLEDMRAIALGDKK